MKSAKEESLTAFRSIAPQVFFFQVYEVHLGMVDQVTPGGNARSAAVNRRRIYFSVLFLFLIWVVVRSIIWDRDNTAGNFPSSDTRLGVADELSGGSQREYQHYSIMKIFCTYDHNW